MNVTTYRVVIADDHPMVRSGIRADLGPPFVIVGEAGDADEALRLIDAHKPDLVVCDLNMPTGRGLRVVRGTAARHGERIPGMVAWMSSSRPRSEKSSAASSSTLRARPIQPL